MIAWIALTLSLFAITTSRRNAQKIEWVEKAVGRIGEKLWGGRDEPK